MKTRSLRAGKAIAPEADFAGRTMHPPHDTASWSPGVRLVHEEPPHHAEGVVGGCGSGAH